jgi:hypothetical protein
VQQARLDLKVIQLQVQLDPVALKEGKVFQV